MSFDTQYPITKKIEGTWSNDPDDKGGETFMGIARTKNPGWIGWKIVDTKLDINEKKALATDPKMISLVKQFYYNEYFVKPGFERISKLSEKTADKLFDLGVNIGRGGATEFLQRTINILNRNQRVYKDIIVDKSIGTATISAFTFCLNSNNEDRILTMLKAYQGSHYIEWMENNVANEKFIGVLDRINI